MDSGAGENILIILFVDSLKFLVRDDATVVGEEPQLQENITAKEKKKKPMNIITKACRELKIIAFSLL